MTRERPAPATTGEQAALEWLYSTQLFGMKLGLDNIRHLLREQTLPQPTQRFIHVAGTNGKGSVCAFIHSLMREAGVNAGLFTSPHLIQFRERIRDTGRMILPTEVADGIQALRSKIEGWDPHPTFFELTLALALDWFRTRNNPWVVLETGLGGRLDATNALVPEVTVITSISLDHQNVLGGTLREIAAEKAGIIKPGVPIITIKQVPEVMDVISRTARERGAPLTILTTPVRGYRLGLAGQHQLWNAALAVAAMKAAGFKLTEPMLREGLLNVQWPARFQRLDRDERIILDGAHNLDSAQTLARTWQQCYPGEKATLLFGAATAKDTRAIIHALQPIAARWHFTSFKSPRTVTAEELRSTHESLFGTAIETHTHDTVPAALAAAKKHSERILVCGSLYLAGEFLAHVRGEERLFQSSSQ